MVSQHAVTDATATPQPEPTSSNVSAVVLSPTLQKKPADVIKRFNKSILDQIVNGPVNDDQKRKLPAVSGKKKKSKLPVVMPTTHTPNEEFQGEVMKTFVENTINQRADEQLESQMLMRP